MSYRKNSTTSMRHLQGLIRREGNITEVQILAFIESTLCSDFVLSARDLDILKEKLSGATSQSLGTKYKVSTQRIVQIFRQSSYSAYRACFLLNTQGEDFFKISYSSKEKAIFEKNHGVPVTSLRNYYCKGVFLQILSEEMTLIIRSFSPIDLEIMLFFIHSDMDRGEVVKKYGLTISKVNSLFVDYPKRYLKLLSIKHGVVDENENHLTTSSSIVYQ